MGGLLRERGGLRSEWEQVLDDSRWSIAEMPQELNNAVYLSYEDMPPHLKQCFLYYSLLPKSRAFTLDQVVAMWMSEGFIHGNSTSLEELGTNYYKDLVSRNLIEPDKSYIKLWVCNMHDVVRSFAQYMTRDEALVAHNAEVNILTELTANKFIRLSIETNLLESYELDWMSVKEQQSARTLISTIQIKMNPVDSLVSFSSLRTLHIEYADVATLVDSLHQLKHLRYLALLYTNISKLPASIGKMKLLQFFDLLGCIRLLTLPDSIVQLGQLRVLGLSSLSSIPRGFRGLTSMRKLSGFQAHMYGHWCSLDELGPLFELRLLELYCLENVYIASSAANARLGEKMHLIDLTLCCTSRLEEDGLFYEEEKQRIEKVFDELCPPPNVENLDISGYFGQQLPSWMMSTSSMPLNNLKILFIFDLACCTQLPTGLCELPYLQFIQVKQAPCIRRVGTAFLQAATQATAFPRLNKLELIGMVEWEEWQWENQVQAMPCLESLLLENCKLRRVPPSLASNARALRKLYIQDVKQLRFIENFLSVVELKVTGNPNLERVANLPNLQKLTITECPKLKVLDSIPALDKLVLEDFTMEELPEYIRRITPRHFQLNCRLYLLAALADGDSGTQWDKFSHVDYVKAYAGDGNNPRKWHMLYTRRENCKLDSNITRSSRFEETLSSSMVDAQGFESVYNMRIVTFRYICNLVKIPFFEDTMANDRIFVDGKVMSLQDLVAVALRVLGSSKPPKIVGLSIGVDESTTLLVTQVFVGAMWDRAALRHARWPYSCSEMEKIKGKFDKIHGLPNCCGILHTSHIRFGSNSHDHEANNEILLQTMVDPDTRFTEILIQGPAGNMNQSSILQDSQLFKECEMGVALNGNKLKISSDGRSDVREYIIGDAAYPLRPWLLTPYLLEGDLSDTDYKKEFNRRHSEVTEVVLSKALARLKDTWQFIQGEGWPTSDGSMKQWTIGTCCLLHNIVIDMEAEGACMEEDYVTQVRQLADDDALRLRDILSQHLIESGEKEREVVPAASGSGDGNKEEQEALPRKKADRGKEKVHDC